MSPRLEFRRTAWFVPAFLLNILFMGTSHVLSRLPISYWALYQDTMSYLSAPFGGDIQSLYDFASILLCLTMAGLCYTAFRRGGGETALLRTVQISSLSFLPLGVEIFLFDHSEWNLTVAKLQVEYGLFPWLTNANLFIIVLASATASSILLWLTGHGGPPALSGSRSS